MHRLDVEIPVASQSGKTGRAVGRQQHRRIRGLDLGNGFPFARAHAMGDIRAREREGAGFGTAVGHRSRICGETAHQAKALAVEGIVTGGMVEDRFLTFRPEIVIAMLEDEVVTRRGWMDRQHFLDLVGATNLIPGPNSTEMVLHVGYERAGWKGLCVAGVSFILPAVAFTYGVFFVVLAVEIEFKVINYLTGFFRHSVFFNKGHHCKFNRSEHWRYF